MVRIAINGLGRIGRSVLRSVIEHKRMDVEVVAINNGMMSEDIAHLVKYDSVHGRLDAEITTTSDSINIAGRPIKIVSNHNPAKLPWEALGIDIVLECTGAFNSRDAAAAHLESGARRVIISAPAKNADITVVYGVNHKEITTKHEIISNASCTTNCLAPVVAVLDESIGIEHGFMTTVHSYTSDQRLLDNSHKDPYRARSAALNIIPTTTGAAIAVSEVLPHLDGKLDGAALRVPTPNVSVVDFTFTPKRKTSIDEINQAMRKSADGALKGILGYTDAPLVSGDFTHDSHSAIFHTDQTKVMPDGLCRVLAWYDNEWGFSCRMIDTAVYTQGLVQQDKAGK